MYVLILKTGTFGKSGSVWSWHVYGNPSPIIQVLIQAKMPFPENTQTSPIVIVDDEENEHTLLEILFKEINTTHPRIYFTNASSALNYLKTSGIKPFLIICDIILIGESGIDFKKQINADPQLRIKSIPFVFMSNALPEAIVSQVYLELTIQGLFEKPYQFDQMKEMIRILIQYWEFCRMPD